MSDTVTEDRKPQPQAKEPAQIVLNRFLKEHDILLGTERPLVEYTGKGTMIVNPPNIIAVYGTDVQKPANGKAN